MSIRRKIGDFGAVPAWTGLKSVGIERVNLDHCQLWWPEVSSIDLKFGIDSACCSQAHLD